MKSFAVVFREYELGWGSKDFHATFFKEEADANRYCLAKNARNNLPSAPDYYISARVEPVNDLGTYKYYKALS